MRLPNVPGVEVFLSVHGTALKEYSDESPVNSDIEASRYVEATPGANFVVNISTDSSCPYPADEIECAVNLDGKNVTNYVLRGEHRPTDLQLDGRLRRRQGQWVLERFLFAKLHLSDDEVEVDLEKDFGRLGVIDVVLTRARKYNIITRPSFLSTPRPSSFAGRFRAVGAHGISERASKGRRITTFATLSKHATVVEDLVTVDDLEYPDGEPFAYYTFKYRSRRALKLEGVIPRGPLGNLTLDAFSDDDFRVLKIYEGFPRVGIITIHTGHHTKHGPLALPVAELHRRCPRALLAFLDDYLIPNDEDDEQSDESI